MLGGGLAAAMGSLALLIIRDTSGTTPRIFGAVLAVIAALWLVESLQRSVKQIRHLQAGVGALPPVVPVHERDTLTRPLGVETTRFDGMSNPDDVMRVNVDLAWRSREGGLPKRAVVPGLVKEAHLPELRRDLKLADPSKDGGRVDVLAKTTAHVDTAEARRAPVVFRPVRPRVRAAVAAAAVGASVVLGGAAVPAVVGDQLQSISFSTAGEDVVDDAFDDINGKILEVLEAAEEARLGSSGLVRSIWITSDLESVWGEFHDPDQARDFRIRTDNLDPSYEEDPTTSRGTFDLSTVQLPDFADMVQHVDEQAGLGAPSGLSIDSVDSDAAAGGDAMVELSYGDGPWQYVHARLDGTVAPLWDATDLAASIDQVAAALADAGVGLDAQQIASLVIASEDRATTQWLEPHGMSISLYSTFDFGGFQLEVYDGSSWLRILQENGKFVEVDEMNVFDEPQLFALSEVPLGALNEIVTVHAETSVAESADYATSFVQVSRGITDDEDDNLDDAGIDPAELDLPIRVLTGYASLPGEEGIYRLDGLLDPGY